MLKCVVLLSPCSCCLDCMTARVTDGGIDSEFFTYISLQASSLARLVFVIL